MRSKILSYAAVFFILVLIFSQISHFFEAAKLKNISYSKAEISGFRLVGVNSDKYTLTGNKLVEEKDKIKIDGFNLSYQKANQLIEIKSQKGIYRKSKDLLELLTNVKIITEDLVLKTDRLRILVKEKRAFNTNKVIMYTKNNKIITYGDNIFINLINETIKLENVKTIYRSGG